MESFYSMVLNETLNGPESNSIHLLPESLITDAQLLVTAKVAF
mgnify:CR=1 FL=1